MYSFQACQLVVINIDAQCEKQPGISPINKFVGLPFNKVCELRLALRDNFMAFQLQEKRHEQISWIISAIIKDSIFLLDLLRFLPEWIAFHCPRKEHTTLKAEFFLDDFEGEESESAKLSITFGICKKYFV